MTLVTERAEIKNLQQTNRLSQPVGAGFYLSRSTHPSLSLVGLYREIC